MRGYFKRAEQSVLRRTLKEVTDQSCGSMITYIFQRITRLELYFVDRPKPGKTADVFVVCLFVCLFVIVFFGGEEEEEGSTMLSEVVAPDVKTGTVSKRRKEAK